MGRSTASDPTFNNTQLGASGLEHRVLEISPLVETALPSLGQKYIPKYLARYSEGFAVPRLRKVSVNEVKLKVSWQYARHFSFTVKSGLTLSLTLPCKRPSRQILGVNL